MAAAVRLAAIALLILLLPGAASGQVEVAPPPHPTLDAVVKEYLRLELPPIDAQLARREYWTSKHVMCLNGIPREELRKNVLVRHLGFRSRPDLPGAEAPFFDGLPFYPGLMTVKTVELIPVEPTPAAVSPVNMNEIDLVAIAVVCKLRGWDELASAAYARAVDRDLSREENRFTLIRQLREHAYRRLSIQVTELSSDRKAAFTKLKWLVGEYPELHTDDAKLLLDRLGKTVSTPLVAKSGTAENLIDNLMDFRQSGTEPADRPGQESFRKLVEMGFDAVPAMIEHLGDDRLSRSSGYDKDKGSFDLTVGHVCSLLLFEVSGRTIINYAPEKDERIDPRWAREWFATARKTGEERWLVEHANLPEANSSLERAGTIIARIIAAKYPSKLEEVYREALRSKSSMETRDFVDEILDSKLSPKQKIALFEHGTAAKDMHHRALALSGLAKLDQTAFSKHLHAMLQELIESEGRDWKDLSWQVPPLFATNTDSECWKSYLAATLRTMPRRSRHPLLLRR